ncbi:acyl-CoA dehydrogenase [Streptomyces ipomoeae]|jgi:acyl-CoA dehydrogenase|uniref:Acyl-CoA dehydrogenase, C-terminal domain protein n=2 Tax=Streptomyces ipomoeae TaxID=103232 RepID=L1KLV7_9ACTN|nr:acyl-CoA dehydrogenase family protein [Streptomyces ipomoeae]EKX61592.1 acyl-CoA dehydrogenase, C-terminal domain protein [Streptomyces ipomoeae 91-03]MDX2693328.1 acyl-CoA dehydrogenase family protein [Streptomyces ipomoeae]MDX2820876.1 acyl-CoA dehydrogenase family protein [Streptomyces ipomoeae]MDX2838973.1 acyl-CoA dehydrogenase family protein [Streptomyces ipomoeae]MDX2873372.1 acyl-CoA dehydrogenase family protein [Streptomyces ipomoeae]
MTTATLPSTFDTRILALPLYEDHHRDLARRLVTWCDEHRQVFVGAGDPEAVGPRVLRALGDAGRLAFLDSRTDDFRALCLAREALAYADDLADYTFSIQALAATPIRRFGTDDQRRRYLPGLAAGTLCAAFAVSEQAAGSDVAAIGLQARETGTGWVLNGDKAWIAHAGIADVYTVIARTGPGPGAFGLTAFLVPATTPGLRVEPVPMIAPRALGHLVFDDCALPEEAVLGRRGGGFAIAMEVLDRFRVTVGAAALGFARRAADAALARARERPMLGGKLFDLATVRAAFADMEVKLDAAALLVARAAWEIDHDGPGSPRHSAVAKLHATEAAQQIVDSAVQIFGAAGLVRDSLPERLYRQIRSLRIYEGSSEVQQAIIAAAIDPHRTQRGAS